MRPNKNEIYNHLFNCQQRFGSYTGRYLDVIARKLGFDRRTIKRNVEKWSKTDTSSVELENREVKRFREIDTSYINLFTFNTIDLEKMVLCVKMEKQDGSLEVIEERNFTVKNVLGLYQGQLLTMWWIWTLRSSLIRYITNA